MLFYSSEATGEDARAQAVFYRIDAVRSFSSATMVSMLFLGIGRDEIERA